jgi:aldose 1-epimerase
MRVGRQRARLVCARVDRLGAGGADFGAGFWSQRDEQRRCESIGSPAYVRLGSSPMPAPSGEQYEIRFGDQRAVVTEVGAGLRSYVVRGRSLLDGYAEDQMCKSGRGQVLMPWPNRIDGGAYEFDGQAYQLPLTEAKAGNAIHGLVRWTAWTVRERAPEQVAMEHTLHPQPGYPFTLRLSVEYVLDEAGLSVRTTVRNPGDQALPFGAGAHPYLTLGTETIDALTLRVPAHTVLSSDERGIPTGSGPVDGSEHDFRAPRVIGQTQLDHCFADLERDADGRARAMLTQAGAGAELWAGERYRYLMVFTGDPLPDVDRRAVAIEPMTCPPNAFRTGEDLIRLGPGESVSLAWGLRPITQIE